MIYEEIYNFCKVRNKKGEEFSNRLKFIISLLEKYGIDYELVEFYNDEFKRKFYNIYSFGSSNKFLSAHHDIVNINSDNANDNSASIINMIAYKIMNPSINLLIMDGEEPPYLGVGSTYTSHYLKEHNISVKWILNLELTGVGKYFFIDNIKTSLSNCINKNFENVFSIMTPFNDAVVFRAFGFVSNVITTINLKDDNIDLSKVDFNNKSVYDIIDLSILYKSHSPKDSVDNMSIEDMKNFTENVVDKIVKSC